jgi:hypothetical protein
VQQRATTHPDVTGGSDELPFGSLAENEAGPLRATATGIALLVKKGTAYKSFSDIYCIDCDFSAGTTSVDLSGAIFDHALLKNANFSHTVLVNASFDSADLVHTQFVGCDAREAKFTDRSRARYLIRYVRATGQEGDFPDFTSARLGGARFTDNPLLALIEGTDDRQLTAGYPKLKDADLEHANLSDMGIYALRHRSPTGKRDQPPESESPFGTKGVDTIQLNRSEFREIIIPRKSWTIAEPLNVRFQNSLRVIMENFESAKHTDEATLPPALEHFKGRYRPPTP